LPPGKKTKTTKTTKKNGGPIGYEAQLWKSADALRSNMDAAEYKHVVLGLIFLKYISDAFVEQHTKLEAAKKQGADPEDRDEYRAQNIFWVPPEVASQRDRGVQVAYMAAVAEHDGFAPAHAALSSGEFSARPGAVCVACAHRAVCAEAV